MTRTERQRGMTLVETLIATSVLALLAVTIAATVQGSVRASTRVASSVEARDELRTAERVLRDLVGATAWTGVPEDRFRFEGRTDALFFSSHGRDGEVDHVRVEAGRDGFSLRVSDLTDGEGIAFDDVLLTRLDRARFTYWGSKGRQSPRWHGSWDANRPPRLVRLEGRGKGGAPLRLELLVDAETPMICAFDPVSRSCRNASE